MSSPDLIPTLTAAERDLLAECEVVIERGMNVFVEVGKALMSVRSNRLYRNDFATFEQYCQDRWGLSSARAYQMIDAAAVVETISSTTVEEINSGEAMPVPATESQARQLAPLLDDPDELVEVWKAALAATTDGNPTAAAVRDVRTAREQAAAAKAAEKADADRQIRDEDRAFRDAVRDIPKATLKDAIDRTQPTVDLRRLADACRSFLATARQIDPDSAARAQHEPEALAAIHEAFDVLTRIHDALGVLA
jgi:hypothetical protein